MKTEILAIIDKSSSMNPLTNETIIGFNSFIKNQKAVVGECNVTTVLFSGQPSLFKFQNEIPSTCVEVLYTALPLESVPEMTTNEYKCFGWTALLDAIGITTEEAGKRYAAMKEEDRPTKVIVLIITDGDENSSARFSHPEIKNIIKHQEEVYSWEFMFLGANIDAFSVGARLGMKSSNISNYTADTLGTKVAYDAFSTKSTMLRSGMDANAVALSSLVTTQEKQ